MGEAADDLWNAAFDAWMAQELDEGLCLPGTLVHETEKAVLWHVEGEDEAIWLPKSQILARDPLNITISSWLADKRGLLEDDDIEF